MMSFERFVEECMNAVRGGEPAAAVEEALRAFVADPNGVLAAVGEPTGACLQVLHRSPELTVMNVVWAPYMSFVPHDHRTWAAIGLYSGREDNIFWRRTAGGAIEASGAKALFRGDAAALPPEVIHSVANPLPRLSCGIHVYGGDFLAIRRSQWNAETLAEEPNDFSISSAVFAGENERLRNAI